MATSTNGIATNADIYKGSKYIYGLNNNQCPTKQTILDNDYGIISINGSYANTQCVKYSDINYNRTIAFDIKNNLTTTKLDKFTITFGSNSDSYFATYTFSKLNAGSELKNNTISLDIANLADYREDLLWVGFTSDGWGAPRTMNFKINNASFKTDDAYHTSKKTTITVIDFLRSYYNNIYITITPN